MSNSVRPHRRQPTRLPRPWDSPGKNTGVGCHFLLQCIKVKSESEVAQSCPTLSDPMDCSPPGSSVHGDFPGKSTGVGCHWETNFWGYSITQSRIILWSLSNLYLHPYNLSWILDSKLNYLHILSPCLFNLYAEYIMRNARLDEAQAGIKIAGRNINYLG